MKTIWDHLSESLTKREYDELHGKLGIGTKKFTRLENYTDTWDLELIEALASAIDADPAELIIRFRIGWDNINLRQFDELLAHRGRSLTEMVFPTAQAA